MYKYYRYSSLLFCNYNICIRHFHYITARQACQCRWYNIRRQVINLSFLTVPSIMQLYTSNQSLNYSLTSYMIWCDKDHNVDVDRDVVIKVRSMTGSVGGQRTGHTHNIDSNPLRHTDHTTVRGIRSVQSSFSWHPDNINTMVPKCFIILAAILALSFATDVENCPGKNLFITYPRG